VILGGVFLEVFVDIRNTHIDKNLPENSTQNHSANTPGGDIRKLTQLPIINKESRNIPTPIVM